MPRHFRPWVYAAAAWASNALLFLFAAQLQAAPEAEKLPPAAEKQIEFRKDIIPILAGSCLKCHTGDKPKGGFRLETREHLLAGGESGAVVREGKSGESPLIQLVAGLEKDRIMPAQGPRLSPEKIGLLRAWIDQGLPWDAGYSFKAQRIAPLAPRKVEVPPLAAGSPNVNPLDRLLAPYLAEHQVKSDVLVSDTMFARRASLDLIGLLPKPEEVEALVGDLRPNKRELYVRGLLENKSAYAAHWMTFWNDALRNAYRGTGFIDGGREQITKWLYESLYDNKPYDQFVRELISPVPGSSGFTKGIVWRGVVNASQRPEMQAAQNIGQVFLGTNLKCASCHDSFVNQWKLKDSYALADVFAKDKLEIHRCDKPTGEFAEVGFLYPDLGTIDATKPREERMRQLSVLMTSPKNGRLARTQVNRLWAWCFGRGLVEPVDDLDQLPWQADVLDFLASDLADHQYDLKHTLELICTSRAYQLPAAGAPKLDDTNFVFRGPLVKRMTAEQFSDAVAALTGSWPDKPVADIGGNAKVVKGKPKSGPELPSGTHAKWVWNDPHAAKGTAGGRIFLRSTFELAELPTSAFAAAACDNEFTLFVNGKQLAKGDDWQKPVAFDLLPQLHVGKNVIAVEAINWPDKETGRGLTSAAPNPAGFVFQAALAWPKRQALLGTDGSWLVSSKLSPGWEKPEFEGQGWSHASEVAALDAEPWKIAPAMSEALSRSPASTTDIALIVRTVFLNDDPLTRALGRPNREQTVTRRDTITTTLQALELTNGETLDATLRQGAAKWQAQAKSADALVDSLYRRGFGRAANATEIAAAKELLGAKVTPDGVEDLLWVLAMLPEFQLIY